MRRASRLDGLEQDIAAAYRAGATIREPAAEHSCSMDNISRALAAAGQPPRQRGGNRSPIAEHDQVIAQAYLAGATLLELAAGDQIDKDAIRRSLARTGTPTRPVGRPRRRLES